MIERAPSVREVMGSISGLVLPHTLTLVVMAALRGDQGYAISITADWHGVRMNKPVSLTYPVIRRGRLVSKGGLLKPDFPVDPGRRGHCVVSFSSIVLVCLRRDHYKLFGFVTDPLRKYRGSVGLIGGEAIAESSYSTNRPLIFP